MASEWYVQVMGEQLGPLTNAQLRKMVAKKQLTPDDSIRRGTSAEWVSASRVRGLFNQAARARSTGADTSAATNFSGDELDSVLGTKVPTPAGAVTTEAGGTRSTSPSAEVPERFRAQLIDCPDCGKCISPNAPSCPNCGHSFFRPNRVVAICLAMILGSFGAHKFYLRKPGQAIVYLLFCWLYIPGIVGLVEGFQYLFMDDDSFARKFGSGPNSKAGNRTWNTQSNRPNQQSTGWRWVGWGAIVLVAMASIGALINPSGNRTTGDNSATSEANKGYVGTTLLDKSALDWQTADYADKLATCELVLRALWQKDVLKPHIRLVAGSIDNLRPFAKELVVCIDAATKPDPDPAKNRQIFGQFKVSQIAAAGVVTMGWGD